MRTLLSLLAIGVEVTMILTLVGLSYGTLHGTARRARGVGADILVRPPWASLLNLSSAPLSDRLPSFFMSQPHVTFAMGTVILPISGFDSITGLDLEQFKKLSGGFRFLQSGPFTGDDDVIVDEYYAREKNLHVGSTLKLVNHVWRVAGIFESGKLARICTKLSIAQDLNGSPQKLSQIYLKIDDPHRSLAVVQQLPSKLPGYGIYTMEEFTSLPSLSSVGLLKDFIGVVISGAGVVGFIVVFMAMYTAVLERTREIGILKAVGVSPGYILNLLFRESLVYRDRRNRRGNPDDVRNTVPSGAHGPSESGSGNCVLVVADCLGNCNRGCFARNRRSSNQSASARCYRGPCL